MVAVTGNWTRGRVLRDPAGAALWLSSGVVSGGRVTVLSSSIECVVFTVLFEPPWVMPGWPIETARIVVTSIAGPVAVPSGPIRSWRHRYPQLAATKATTFSSSRLSLEQLVGALCLWYPRDSASLTWDWPRGLDDFFRIVQRHLWMEEFFRRTLRWPGEETPHGERLDGTPHPILSESLIGLA